MSTEKSRPRRRNRWGLCGVPMVFLCAGPALAQNQPGGFRPMRVDTHGNARPWYPERRIVGSFANEVQLQASRGNQLQGRRLNQRGAGVEYELSPDLFAGFEMRRSRPAPHFGESSPATRKIYGQYGGFGRRSRSVQDGEVATVFARRYALIEATSRNAPVQRALLERSSSAVLPGSMRGVPYVTPETAGTIAEGGPTLAERLRGGVARSHVRIRSDAWGLFREGRYRQAARTFDSAALLQPADLESRIGELFSYLSVGAMRTSMTLLRQLARREANPFRYELNLSDRYARLAEARETCIRCQLFTQAGSDVADAAALYPFVLWYLGEREEAMAATAGLTRDHRSTVYANWGGMMKAATATFESGAEKP